MEGARSAGAGGDSADADAEPAAVDPVPVDLRDYVDFDQAAATDRRVFATDVVAVDLVCLEPHQLLDARSFPTADVIYTVLGGRAWVVTDAAEVTLEPLQSVMVPAPTVHGLRNHSPDPLILHVVVSPPDEAPPTRHGPANDAPTAGGAPPATLLDRLRRLLGGPTSAEDR